MKVSIALLSVAVISQFATSKPLTAFERIFYDLSRILAKPCVEQVCDRIVNGTEYEAGFSHKYEVGDFCYCKHVYSQFMDKYTCKYEVDPISDLANQEPNKKVVDSWACDIEKSLNPECLKELCDLIIDGKSEGEDSFKDEYQVGDSCTCSKNTESDSPFQKFECKKAKKLEGGKATAFWMCDSVKSKGALDPVPHEPGHNHDHSTHR